MSQPPPPPPGNPPPPGGGYGYPGQAGPVPGNENPYAQPVPPGQNPYAQAPTQPAFPQQQYGGRQGPPPPPGQVPPPPPPPGQVPQGQTPPPQYGYPQPGQVPPQQQAYGYPQQQQPPYGPGPSGYPAPSGGSSNNKLIVIVAAVVAAVLVIGGGVYFATKSGGGDDPAPKPQANAGGANGGTNTAKTHNSTLSYKWDKPADPVASKDNLKSVLGVWFTDKYVVKNEIDKVVGYDLGTGAVAWTVPTPSSGDCTAARDSNNNLTAVQFGANCEQVMVIDLAAGRAVWTAKLPVGSSEKADFDYSEMAISGDTLGVDWLEGSIGYRLSTQKVLWRSGNGDCEDDGYAGGKQFVAIVNCGYKTYKVQVIDPDNNGSAKWSWTAPVGTKVSAVVSTDPVVVVLGTEGERQTDVATIVDGRLQSRVSLGTDKYDISTDGTEMQAVHNVIVSSDTLYLSLTSKHDSNGQVLSGIVAFNLSDGKQKWIAKPDSKHDIQGLAIEDGKVLAYEPAGYDVQGRLVTLDPASGALTTYAQFDTDASQKLNVSAMRSYPVWHDGHFIIATRTVYASSSDQTYLVTFG
ncbi:hypothetical protein [Streptomyces sp. NPDC008317]|uniref:hypothetical protein n=1 Tax=Streptomyces sp. NPDC008317 TaxID=3364827 RepID=UPI0036EA1766